MSSCLHDKHLLIELTLQIPNPNLKDTQNTHMCMRTQCFHLKYMLIFSILIYFLVSIWNAWFDYDIKHICHLVWLFVFSHMHTHCPPILSSSPTDPFCPQAFCFFVAPVCACIFCFVWGPWMYIKSKFDIRQRKKCVLCCPAALSGFLFATFRLFLPPHSFTYMTHVAFLLLSASSCNIMVPSFISLPLNRSIPVSGIWLILCICFLDTFLIPSSLLLCCLCLRRLIWHELLEK